MPVSSLCFLQVCDNSFGVCMLTFSRFPPTLVTALKKKRVCSDSFCHFKNISCHLESVPHVLERSGKTHHVTFKGSWNAHNDHVDF